MSAPAPSPDNVDFILKRTFDAPRALVFKAWTEREHLMKWMGPTGTTMPQATLDLRPGGRFHYCMRMPNGAEMWGLWQFREIVVPERLVLVQSFADPAGNVAPAPMIDGWPLTTLSTTTFVERGGKTEMTLHWTPLDATDAQRALFASMHASMTGGWGGTMAQLDAHLARLQG